MSIDENGCYIAVAFLTLVCATVSGKEPHNDRSTTVATATSVAPLTAQQAIPCPNAKWRREDGSLESCSCATMKYHEMLCPCESHKDAVIACARHVSVQQARAFACWPYETATRMCELRRGGPVPNSSEVIYTREVTPGASHSGSTTANHFASTKAFLNADTLGNKHTEPLSGWQIGGIVLGSVFGSILLVVVIYVIRKRFRKKGTNRRESRDKEETASLESSTGVSLLQVISEGKTPDGAIAPCSVFAQPSDNSQTPVPAISVTIFNETPGSTVLFEKSTSRRV